MRRGEQGEGLLAQETGLGWVLSGRVPCGGPGDLESCTNFVSTHVLKVGTEVLPVVDDADSANNLVNKLWDLESIGIREKDTVQEAFVKNITKEDGKYCVKLPLKEQHTLLPDNYDLSLSRLNSLVKRLRRDPETLKERAQGKSYRVPKPAALPEGRLSGAVAFADVGVDYAGPLYVKTSEGMAKAYICLFTCSTSRAVHLEVAPDLTTQAFLRCFKRFIARRGLPVTIRSDNAQTFRRANKELIAIFESEEVQRFVGQKGIIWRFMLEKSPFFGGFYERMVQVVKRCLRKILGSAKLNYEELVTVITEVEGTINSRPLTYIYSDDIEEPITPAHLIMGRRILTLPSKPDELEDEDYIDTSTTLQRRARYLNSLLESFWKRWRNEYLLSLREFHHCKEQNKRQAGIKKGDVVLVKDENVIRGKWKTAVVEDLIESNDGEIRGASVRLVNTKGTLTRLKRPLQLLYPIEVNSDEDRGKTLDISLNEEPPLNVEEHTRPPRRVAAMNADLIRRTIDHPVDDQWGEC
eukprot:Seg4627.3 transcript_id=Seg4627.3/GoldUCD/mRNA.D3Y31 product="hypothetical protein" protein_id=Seg4627.3/GoldUCD/D3Y31